MGDTGYACTAYLMTPILKRKNAREVHYILHIGVLGVLLRDALDCKETFSVSALGTAGHRLGEYPRHHCGHCSDA